MTSANGEGVQRTGELVEGEQLEVRPADPRQWQTDGEAGLVPGDDPLAGRLATADGVAQLHRQGLPADLQGARIPLPVVEQHGGAGIGTVQRRQQFRDVRSGSQQCVLDHSGVDLRLPKRRLLSLQNEVAAHQRVGEDGEQHRQHKRAQPERGGDAGAEP